MHYGNACLKTCLDSSTNSLTGNVLHIGYATWTRFSNALCKQSFGATSIWAFRLQASPEGERVPQSTYWIYSWFWVTWWAYYIWSVQQPFGEQNPQAAGKNLQALPNWDLHSGNIPPELGHVLGLHLPDLSYNNLTAKVPLEIMKCSVFQQLLLDNHCLNLETILCLGRALSISKAWPFIQLAYW